MNRMGFSSTFFILVMFKSLHDGCHAHCECPNGFQLIGSGCYKGVKQPASWPEAKEYCEVMGGDLASVADESEQKIISKIVQTGGGRYWIDGTSLIYQNEWWWMRRHGTSTKFTYTNWAPGQPETKGEFCMAAYSSNNGQWHDQWCVDQLYYICYARPTF